MRVGKAREEKRDEEEEEEGEEEGLSNGSASPTLPHSLPRGQAYLEKVNERKRTWDYFEINHPKAISDKKLEQLKAKYTRRKTEASLLLQAKAEKEGKQGKENNKEEGKKGRKSPPPTVRTISMPIIEGLNASIQPGAPLSLAWDPLTGEQLEDCTESVDSGRESDNRKLSSSSNSEESSSSRKSSQRKSCHLSDILELADRIIPDHTVLECFIDPFTGQFITSEVSKPAVNNKRNLVVSVCQGRDCDSEGGGDLGDEGVGSLPCSLPTTVPTTPTMTTRTHPLSLPDTDDGIGSEPGRVRGSELSLASGEETEGLGGPGGIEGPEGPPGGEAEHGPVEVCTGSVARGIQKFQGEPVPHV